MIEVTVEEKSKSKPFYYHVSGKLKTMYTNKTYFYVYRNGRRVSTFRSRTKALKQKAHLEYLSEAARLCGIVARAPIKNLPSYLVHPNKLVRRKAVRRLSTTSDV